MALAAYCRSELDQEREAAELTTLLDQIRSQEISDPQESLQFALLAELYPSVLSPTKLISHLPVSASPLPMSLEIFFAKVVPSRSDGARAAELMEGLIEKFEDLLEAYSVGPAHNIYMLSGMIANTMLRTLEDAGRSIDPEKLYDWLGVASDPRVGQGGASQETLRKIRGWLSDQPGMQKSLIQVGLARSRDDPDAIGINRRLFGARRPKDFGHWCLKQAESAVRTPVIQYFLTQAMDADYGNRSAHQLINALLDGNPRLKGLYKELRAGRKRLYAREKGILANYHQNSRNRIAEQKLKRRERRGQVKEQELSLRENRASPHLLFLLAKGYLGGFGDVTGPTSHTRLREFLDRDEALVRVVLQSFRETVNRDDLPNVETLLKLDEQSKLHLLALPFVAGLHELEQSKPDGDLGLSKEQMQLAVTIRLLAPLWTVRTDPDSTSGDREPKWFKSLLKRHPQWVADVMVRSARHKLSQGSHSIAGLQELARDRRYRAVAHLATLQLLKGFRVRCSESQLSDLRHLLHSACLNCDKDSFARLIGKKLTTRSMTARQRVFWLAAGLVVSPDEYAEKLDSYLVGNEQRINCLAWFLARWYDMPAALLEGLDVSGLRLLIRHIGSICKPRSAVQESDSRELNRVTVAMESALSVGEFINRLAALPSEAATVALAELSLNHDLIEWRAILLDSMGRQSAVRREAEVELCSPQQVIQTLSNSHPANSADLAALTMVNLREISLNVRHGNTSDWRQYWDRAGLRDDWVPSHENECRNALLSDLQERLKHFGVDAQPEGQHADEKRSDIRVAYGSHIVPIEAKKSCSPDLWSAIKTQLIAKYTGDPGADGYGIYLVFWFGVTQHCRPTLGSGSPPTKATELQKRLEGLLTEQEGRKVSVCVIDVAQPQA